MFILGKTQDILKVEIMNNSFDWINPLMTFISVFLAALLAYYYTNKIEKKKNEQQKKEIFINEMINQCGIIYDKYMEILHLISLITILDDDNFKEKFMNIIHQIDYCLKDLKALSTLIEISLEKNVRELIDYTIIGGKVTKFILFFTDFIDKNTDILYELCELIEENNIDVEKIKNKAKEIKKDSDDEIFFDCIKELKLFLFQ